MGKVYDLTGFAIHRLTVLRRADESGYWLCRCSCGREAIAATHRIRTGRAKSCGCLMREVAADRMRKRRTSHGMTDTPEFAAYTAAKKRCNQPTTNQYANYGGRGIQFRFSSFEEFFGCLGLKPTPKHTIERIDSNGHYEAGNVRWATLDEQASNRRTNRVIEHAGRRQTLAQWSRETGIRGNSISYRLEHGWSVAAALSTPVSGGKS